ncbi:hypothetical protein TTHERM_00494850 (macronuclear) [Tetrahymena thermophila SB210]|uniref:Uncharacterized protein n=1 Tax=Tetrahymena thermophila (strain SB210) TaxID=312017 RepID=I7MLT3_TETTS|nr:hypothetical protein TTHERM_00494850 [Tetrahymena thermophila SB210]EAS03023.1 hypothetical protein TTHERM_00494850 [Tetrahymena thermophila SB210]|eukprot:XP_001023268.1 hypothetical protein TTHERM_00494850 [Tetrahymena thermophila SB210]
MKLFEIFNLYEQQINKSLKKKIQISEEEKNNTGKNKIKKIVYSNKMVQQTEKAKSLCEYNTIQSQQIQFLDIYNPYRIDFNQIRMKKMNE